MEKENSKDFYKQTFSQREGKAPLPEPMQIGEISDKFRQLIWFYVDREIQVLKYPYVAPISNVLLKYKPEVLYKPHDKPLGFFSLVDFSLSRSIDGHIINAALAKDSFGLAENTILQKEYDEVLTFIEYFLQHEECPPTLRENLIRAFDEARIAYHVVEIGGRPTIVPRASMEAGEATQKAIETIQEGGMEGAATHLRQAAEHINAQQYADSIADSIHAVESVARKIDPKAKTLGEALNSLEKAELLRHGALKQAFGNLYGYTSDEQGIRHALIDKDSSDVDVDEAVFMFGACASFAAYLVSKHRELEKQRTPPKPSGN